MNFLKVLYDTYKNAENNGLIDDFSSDYPDKVTILPLYHSNKRVGKEDTIEIVINTEGEFEEAYFVDENRYVIFPISEESYARTSAPAAHPLCDYGDYIISGINEKKYTSYMKEINLWEEYNKENKIENEVSIIKKYLENSNIVEDLINRKELFPSNVSISNNIISYTKIDNEGKENFKKLDLSKVFITFSVDDEGDRVSTTSNKTLHKNFIDYQTYTISKKEKNYCVLQNKEMYCTAKHRGLLGNAKLISISNNKEPYYGRFKSGDSIISIGYETSFMIHNMLKFLLENKNTKRKLGESIYLIIWQDNDIYNDENIDLIQEISPEEQFSSKYLEAVKDFLNGKKSREFDDNNVYIAILHKVSNGRIALKYFKNILKNDLYRNVENWYKTTSWNIYNYSLNKYEEKTYSLNTLANFVYGNEVGNMIKSKDLVKNKVLEKLLKCILERKKIPKDIVKKLNNNVYNRQRYSSNSWNLLLKSALMLNKKNIIDEGDDYDMSNLGLDKNNTNESYLYGRLLAVYEKLENSTYNKESRRQTNAEKYFSSYQKNPYKINQILRSRLQPYEVKLSKTKGGLYTIYKTIISEIVEKLPSEIDNKKFRLGPSFLLGYDQQMSDLYKEKEKGEQGNDNIR